MNKDVSDDLVARCLDGRATHDDVRQLESQLESDADFRRAWLRIARLDALLHRLGRSSGGAITAEALEPGPLLEASSGQAGWTHAVGKRALPLMVGFAGLAVGIVFASVVWAVAPQRTADYRRIDSDGFETGAGPQVTGLPAKPDVWSGDQSELVRHHGNVAPRSGNRMLRFVSASYEGKPTQDGASCDVVKLIDLRPYRRQIVDGTWTVRITAFFNVSGNALDGREQCSVAGFAFDAMTDVTQRTPGSLRDKSLAYACCQRIDLDDEPATWQAATTEFRLPVEADFLAVHCGVSEYTRAAGLPTKRFAGHYCDDVSVTLVHRPDVP
jgi:hypothetical protein